MPAFADHGVVTVRRRHDELMGIGALGRLDDRVAAGVGVSVGDVAGDGALEEDRLLKDDADLAAEAAKLDLADVVAVDPNGAGIDIPEPRQEVHQALSCRIRWGRRVRCIRPGEPSG